MFKNWNIFLKTKYLTLAFCTKPSVFLLADTFTDQDSQLGRYLLHNVALMWTGPGRTGSTGAHASFMQPVPVNAGPAADLCCYESAASDTTPTPDARAVLAELGGNNNSDAGARQSPESQSGLGPEHLHTQVPSNMPTEWTRGSLYDIFHNESVKHLQTRASQLWMMIH